MGNKQRFHISRNGEAAPCTAQGPCPLGGEHFDTYEEADNHAQELNKEKYGVLAGVDEETSLEDKLHFAGERVSNQLQAVRDLKVKIKKAEDLVEEVDNNEDRRIANYSLMALNEELGALEGELNTFTEDLYQVHEDLHTQEEVNKLEIEAEEREQERKRRIEAVVFDTDSYMNEYDRAFVKDDLNYIIQDTTVKPRGEVVSWAMISERESHYGSIGGNGLTGYSELRGGDDLAEGILSINTDRVEISDEDGEFVSKFYDHDGVHVTRAVPITKSRYDKFQHVINTKSHEDVLEYLDTLPRLKMKKKK